MLWGLIQNAATLAKAPVAIDFVGFMGEETQQLGSKHFAKHHADEYEFGIAGEPTSLQIVNCTKGCLWATIRASGKSTHASQPHLGENAILKLMDGLRELHGAFFEEISKHSHPTLGSPTLNLGMIKGGARPNIVPSSASAQLDIRTVPELVKAENAASILRRFKGELEIVQAAESPPMEMPEDHPWLLKLQAIDPTLILTGAPWFSDAAHLSAGGLASICLGPGSIDQAHTADEFITIKDLEDGVRWFSKMIAGLSD